MSTEAMREAFEKWVSQEAQNRGYSHMGRLLRVDAVSGDYCTTWVDSAWIGWQAATANQEALIKAALDAAAEAVHKQWLEVDELPTVRADALFDAEEAIRQITPKQVMERMK